MYLSFPSSSTPPSPFVLLGSWCPHCLDTELPTNLALIAFIHPKQHFEIFINN